MSVGIDYGLGQTNIDTRTRIRYGVISQHSVGQAWYDSAEADYGPATCPQCGNEATDDLTDAYDDETGEAYENDGRDYACHTCKRTFWSDEAFGDEPTGWSLDDGEYKAIDCLDSEIMIISSPYYTFAPFCSPCVPGAGNLDSAREDGVKSYCFGHEWFDDGKAPYRVFRVEDDTEVLPE
jgi:hypothetical protein